MSLQLVDARSDSLTVTWPSTSGATRYVLEYRTSNEDDFQLLSDKLTQPQARKRNLKPVTSYYFRVAPIVNGIQDEWITHSDVFTTLSTTENDQSMAAPKTTNGGNQALVVSWSKIDDVTDYELQMRENEGGKTWNTIATSLSSTEVRKKNLTSKSGYQFRVRPVGESTNAPFSPPSEPAVAKGLSAAMKRWFQSLDDGTLLKSGASTPVPLEDALAGKEFVLLYASAHWCPPCRQFTPMLANWYKTVQNNVEVVFLSADHDEAGFRNYFATHPWMAVDYDDDTREQLMAAIKVTGIPRLVVIHAETGKIVEENAVGKPLDLTRWRGMVKQ
ncbi:thioredoxin-like protein [Nitzschia inconspicua]|uniref:protein-disulfide reductase n=1 Tax=Nitzschia inconspicua TaxID=303405 RepID=A0A9K3KID4_9STRA|nr:thioredoxin-like protein [Nitzschia inconspicua]